MTGARVASGGYDVFGLDVDQVKVDLIRRGRSPIVENGLGDLVLAGIESQLGWDNSQKNLLAAYARLFSRRRQS